MLSFIEFFYPPILPDTEKFFLKKNANRIIPVFLHNIPIFFKQVLATVFLLHHFFEKQTKKKGANHEKKEI